MAKILKFPTKKEIQEKDDIEVLNEASNRCVDSSHYLLEVLEEFITTGEISEDKEPVLDPTIASYSEALSKLKPLG